MWAADETKKLAPSARTPEMFSLSPVGATKGTTLEVEILGENLDGTQQLEVTGRGITTRILEASSLHARAEIVVDPGADAGMHSVRLVSSLGVSNLLGFRIGELRETREREPNNNRDEAEQIRWPGVIDAVLFPDEDADFYRFHATAGQRLTMEVLAARNGSGLNAEMYLLDASGTRLAVGDDEAGTDPAIEHTFKKEGDYFVVVRGTFNVLNITFPTGHPAYVYQLRILSPPWLETVTPSVVAPGATVAAEISGEGLDVVTELGASAGVAAKIASRSSNRIHAVLTADSAGSGFREVWAVSPHGFSTPLRLLVSEPIPTVHEVESRDQGGAQRFTPPAAVVGTIEKPGEPDHYIFSITEPGTYVFEVEAGRLNSLLDSVLTLQDAQGEVLATNDDGIFEQASEGDSKIMYRFAEPGDYRLEIKQAVLDLHGPLYQYRLVARKARPHFALTAVGGDQSTPWARSADRLIANPGSAITIPVKVEWIEGLEASGTEIQLRVEGLPDWIPMAPLTTNIRDGKHADNSHYGARVEIPLSIPQDVKVGSHPFRIKGEATVGGEVLAAEETITVSALGRYVMAASGGFPQSATQRYLSIVSPIEFTLRPEIGDERYPVRFTIQPGTAKILPLTLLPPQKFPLDLDFSAENLPRGLTIQQVELSPDTKQYLLHLKAASDGERGWFPLVTFVATDRSTGVAVPTSYFGMAMQ